jgi:hypothetical protein
LIAEAVRRFQPSFQNTGGTPMILFARPQRHARPRAHRIIGVSPVSLFLPRGDHRKPEDGLDRGSCSQIFNRHFQNTGGDAYDTFRSASASRISPSPSYHRRLACVLHSCQGRRSKAWRRILIAELFVDFQPSFPEHRRDAYDTFRSAPAPPTSPTPSYHRRPACLLHSCQGR